MSCDGETTSLDRQIAEPDAGALSGASGDGINLYPYIHRDQVFGLNVEPPESAKVPIKPWDARLSLDTCAESGVDDQMIITIPFTVPVRIQSILLNPGLGDFAPSRCTAFVNRPHGIDFDDVAQATEGDMRLGPPTSGRAQADFALLPGAAGVTAYPVGASRFSNTNSVSLMLSDSATQQSSHIFYIGFIGKALDVKKDSTPQNNVAAADSSTHSVDGIADKYGAASTPSVR
ncbi:hypothetical protein MVES1_002121 [Malassezia vespertilionis]|uniref:PITH domain-containing protein n=1 Tax=Malassezia vespertilionis TaxID=2020962 RepID=A0A2N1JC44_9BASI|nr:uncharacterized protein MVES1_002121 [Malassezia vespertilionis]PKI84131.1 hypothetical protein MVES_002001 [Malassezia vespertilionis]WFD06767.1 hypothetical protein MVES1_002121 [Malassezia vespertilionis]